MPELIILGRMIRYFDIVKDLTFSGATFKDYRDAFCFMREEANTKIVTVVRFVPFSTSINSYTQYGDANRYDYPLPMSDEIILEEVIRITYGEEQNFNREDYKIKSVELF
jgi:hypothetical protein